MNFVVGIVFGQGKEIILEFVVSISESNSVTSIGSSDSLFGLSANNWVMALKSSCDIALTLFDAVDVSWVYCLPKQSIQCYNHDARNNQ